MVWVVDAEQVVWMPGGLRTEIYLDGDVTGGAFCMLFDYPPVGWSLPAHRHRNEAETIHIVEGEFEMDVDAKRSRLLAGDTIHVPRGAVHAGRNIGGSSGRRMVIFSPSGMERFFLEAGVSTPDSVIDLKAAEASALRFGWEFVAGPARRSDP